MDLHEDMPRSVADLEVMPQQQPQQLSFAGALPQVVVAGETLTPIGQSHGSGRVSPAPSEASTNGNGSRVTPSQISVAPAPSQSQLTSQGTLRSLPAEGQISDASAAASASPHAAALVPGASDAQEGPPLQHTSTPGLFRTGSRMRIQ